MSWTLIMLIIFINPHDYIKDQELVVEQFRSHRACERALDRIKKSLEDSPYRVRVEAKCYKN